MYTVQVLKTNAPLVKQIVSEMPEPQAFEDQLGRLLHATQHGEQAEYDYQDGFVVVGPVAE